MLRRTSHFALASKPWSRDDAVAAVAEIAADATNAIDASSSWPAHPLDGQADDPGCVYFGAAGVVWALDHLARVGAVAVAVDFEPALATALERNAPLFAASPYPGHGSLLMGELGIRLVAMRVAPTRSLADRIHALAAANTDLPTLELMWGLPGSMLACVHMGAMTGDGRFKALFQAQASRLLAELEATDDGPIWSQELYGEVQRWLGPVHGFAGNMVPLLRGWDWLAPDQRAEVAEAVPRTLASHAVRSELGAEWPATVPSGQTTHLCQHCHGAPGMVTTFADAPFSTPDFEALLLQGGELTWNAGPLTKGSNLCHGTGGNGYPLLKLYKRTGNPLWLERARAFATMAIDQVREARSAFGRGRYSLWTGDVGLAVYLWDCVTAEPKFPIVDVV